MSQLRTRSRRILFGILALVGTAAALPTRLYAECYREYRLITTTVTDLEGNIISVTMHWEYVGSYCTGGNIGAS
jgi:hypothetical protein